MKAILLEQNYNLALSTFTLSDTQINAIIENTN